MDEDLALDEADGEGEEPSAETRAELAALTEAGLDAGARDAADDEADVPADADLAATVAALRQELAAQREEAVLAVGRYRAALLAAEPELPEELVAGDTVEALEASVGAARAAVSRIRAQLLKDAPESLRPRGFPAGAPARESPSSEGMSAAEKIAYGLAQRELD